MSWGTEGEEPAMTEICGPVLNCLVGTDTVSEHRGGKWVEKPDGQGPSLLFQPRPSPGTSCAPFYEERGTMLSVHWAHVRKCFCVGRKLDTVSLLWINLTIPQPGRQ